MVGLNIDAATFGALRALGDNHKRFENIIGRISSGFDVSSYRDNAAAFTTAKNLRADLAGLNASLASLDHAIIAVDVASVATGSIADILTRIKSGVTNLVDARVQGDTEREAIFRNELQQYKGAINFIAQNARVGGVNLIDGGDDAISALAGPNGDEILDFAHQSLLFGGALVTLPDDAADYTAEAIDASIGNVGAAASHFATAARRLEIEKDFTVKLHNVVETAIGDLVDTDLAKASAELAAAQVKEQLGITSLNIANQSRESVLGLFKDEAAKVA